MNRTQALEKVVKLHALFHGTTFQGEKEAAKRQAKKLCAIHNITGSDIRVARGIEPRKTKSHDSQRSQRSQRSHWYNNRDSDIDYTLYTEFYKKAKAMGFDDDEILAEFNRAVRREKKRNDIRDELRRQRSEEIRAQRKKQREEHEAYMREFNRRKEERNRLHEERIRRLNRYHDIAAGIIFGLGLISFIALVGITIFN